MADESNCFVKSEAEQAITSRVEEKKKSTEGDSAESEEEKLAYDRSDGETSEDSGTRVFIYKI